MNFPSPRLLVLAVVFHLTLAGVASDAVSPVVVPRLFHPGSGQICYFLLTDRFANGSPANDTGGIPGGRDEHGFDPTVISHFHGGDFAGLTARLDYIKNLGATAVWVTPPFRNKPVQSGSAAYHGYWILDFLAIDPHLGTTEEFRAFVFAAHARGLKVYLDIIVNHTADVIQFPDGATDYVSKAAVPNRDARGRPFDERAVAFNGVNAPAAFPKLAADRSFAYPPIVPPAEAAAKNPTWLNDVTKYHNRGNSTFAGESSVDGDFVGLDDLFTEDPAVVRGFIDIYRQWIETYRIDGFRIDTARHVNLEFWQAFAPAIRAGMPEFIQFGEVANDASDIRLLSEFSTTAPLDTTLDFGFFRSALAFVSQGKSAADFSAVLAQDDYYTDHDSNVHATTTFLGNHDAGRFAHFLQKDNPGAKPEQLAELVRFGHALMFLVRGQPVLYYGDEQGMIGRGGHDMQARESMFPAQAPDFKTATLLGTTRTGADDKFDPQHPFYRFIRTLADTRTRSPALSRGAMILRPTDQPGLFAFSRIERGELVEHLAVFNNSRTAALTATIPTSQPAGAEFQRIGLPDIPVTSGDALLVTDANGRLKVTLPPLSFALWRARTRLPATSGAPAIALASPASGAALRFDTSAVDGHTFVNRQEILATVTGGDGMAEVTFVMERGSRPGQFEVLGTDDAPPYRIFWKPPPDLAPGEKLSFLATVDDLRGNRVATRTSGVTVEAAGIISGIQGAAVPQVTRSNAATLRAKPGDSIKLAVTAKGTAPFEYQWLRDGAVIVGANQATLTAPARSGRFTVLVRNRAGTTLSGETVVEMVGR